MENDEVGHPLEEVFDIESGTTEKPQSTELSVADKSVATDEHVAYDDKDGEINQQLDNIHKQSLDAFADYMDEADGIDPKYKARVGEVASTFLGHALQAVKEKAHIKNAKDRLTTTSNGGNHTTTTNNNSTYNVVAVDRDTLLKQMVEAEEQRRESIASDVIDVTPKK